MPYRFLNAIILFPVFLMGCATTKTSIDVIRKPDLMLPSNIKTMALVDRAQPDKKHKLKNALEGFTSGESYQQDKQGREELFSGLINILSTSPCLRTKMTTIQLAGNGTGTTFPIPIDTSEINKIFSQYNADAVAVLELFDSDNVSSRHYVVVKVGFRIYDKNSVILDQYFYTCRMKYKKFRHNYHMRYNKVYTKSANYNERASVNSASFQAGVDYGRRIAPTFINEKRNFFVRGNAALMMASRSAEIGEWKKASELWQEVVKSTDVKNAGRAAYNLALASEIAGDLKQAQYWINRSYSEFNNREARKYGDIINRRIAMQINKSI
jgi:hypothetical protein